MIVHMLYGCSEHCAYNYYPYYIYWVTHLSYYSSSSLFRIVLWFSQRYYGEIQTFAVLKFICPWRHDSVKKASISLLLSHLHRGSNLIFISIINTQSYTCSFSLSLCQQWQFSLKHTVNFPRRTAGISTVICLQGRSEKHIRRIFPLHFHISADLWPF